MNNFIPFYDKIEVKPFTQESIILSQEESLIEAGEVVAIGENVTFVKVGDIIFFDAWGCSKTPERDGIKHYVVPEKSEIILGKMSGDWKPSGDTESTSGDLCEQKTQNA